MNNQHQPEEIDIIQFFNAIGKFFNAILLSIKNIILSIFYFFLDSLLYLKRNYLFLAAGILLGLLLSFFSASGKKKFFIANAMVRTNYQAQYLLKEQFETFNYMINNQKIDLLAKELGIDKTIAQHFVKFDLEPVINDVFLIDQYNNYLRTKDTVVYKYIEYKDFKKEYLSNPEINSFWELHVKANQPDVFFTLNKALKKMIENDEGIAKRQKEFTTALKIAKEKTLKSLQDIDTMRAVYDKVTLEIAKNKQPPQSNIILNKNIEYTSEKKEKPYNLFNVRAAVLKKIEKIALRLNKLSDPLIYLSSFPKMGKKEESILYNRYVLYALLGFLSVLFILLMIDFNKYLNKYQRAKQIK